jgi:hypothetical protein
MPLHPALACEPPASRRLRRWAPLFLFLGLIAITLVPGLIAQDRPFQRSLCDDLGQAVAACASPERTISAAMHADGAALAKPAQVH